MIKCIKETRTKKTYIYIPDFETPLPPPPPSDSPTSLIPPHETWEVLDSSKLMDFITCPRKYFFRYILGWTSIYPNLHLVFGSAWHLAKETLLQEGYTEEAVEHAMKRFEALYAENFAEITWLDKAPKNPAHAREGLLSYIAQYGMQDNFQNIATEVGIAVPIDDNKVIYGKLDSINKTPEGKYFSLEHKTSSQQASWFFDQWLQRFQVGTYNHILHSMYLPEDIYGVIIDASIFRKLSAGGKGIEHMRVPVVLSQNQMLDWLLQANYYYDRVIEETHKLEKETAQPQVMEAFPKQTTSCIQYNKLCPFFHTCTAWTNPLKHLHELPDNVKIEYWDPRKLDEEGTPIHKTMNLETKEVKDEQAQPTT